MNFDEYYLNIAKVVSEKSKDSTKHGCVIVGEHNNIVSTGYNNPPRGSDDSKVPFDVRPNKYDFIEHSERNAIYNAAKHGIALNNSTFYVTGIPCIDCFRAIISCGAKRLIFPTSKHKIGTIMNNYAQCDVGDLDVYPHLVFPSFPVLEYDFDTQELTPFVVPVN